MGKYIPLDALVAEIKRRKELVSDPILSGNDLMIGERNAYFNLLSFIDTLEVKEVNLKEEISLQWSKFCLNGKDKDSFVKVAKHFFELGLRVNNPITAADRGTAEEIIINLKRVESDYRIDLTKEIEWLRSKVKKGE